MPSHKSWRSWNVRCLPRPPAAGYHAAGPTHARCGWCVPHSPGVLGADGDNLRFKPMGGWKGERTLYPNLQGGKFAQEKLVKRAEMVHQVPALPPWGKHSLKIGWSIWSNMEQPFFYPQTGRSFLQFFHHFWERSLGLQDAEPFWTIGSVRNGRSPRGDADRADVSTGLVGQLQ